MVSYSESARGHSTCLVVVIPRSAWSKPSETVRTTRILPLTSSHVVVVVAAAAAVVVVAVVVAVAIVGFVVSEAVASVDGANVANEESVANVANEESVAVVIETEARVASRGSVVDSVAATVIRAPTMKCTAADGVVAVAVTRHFVGSAPKATNDRRRRRHRHHSSWCEYRRRHLQVVLYSFRRRSVRAMACHHRSAYRRPAYRRRRRLAYHRRSASLTRAMIVS